MNKSTKPHDEERDGNQAKLPDFVADDVDELLFELREYLRTASLENLKSVSSRNVALQELGTMLQRYTNAFKKQVEEAGNETTLGGLGESLLNYSDSHALELCLANIGTPAGKARLSEHLRQLPFPQYESNPNDPTTVVQILENGTRTIGRFVDRKFVAVNHD